MQNAIETENLFDCLCEFVRDLPSNESLAATDILRFVALVLRDNRIMRQLTETAIGCDAEIQEWLPVFAGHLDDDLVARAIEQSIRFHEAEDMGKSSPGVLYHTLRNRMSREQQKRLERVINTSDCA